MPTEHLEPEQQTQPTESPDGTRRLLFADYSECKPVLSVAEYRNLLNDHITADERIEKRIAYIERVARGFIRLELEKYE